MVVPLSTNAFHFTGITSPGSNPQSAPVVADTNPHVTTTPQIELSPQALDASRSVTTSPGTAESSTLHNVDNQRRQEEPRQARERREQNAESEKPDAPRPHGRMFAYKAYPEINRTQISILDRSTGEPIRKIPPDRMIKFTEAFQEHVGKLFDIEA